MLFERSWIELTIGLDNRRVLRRTCPVQLPHGVSRQCLRSPSLPLPSLSAYVSYLRASPLVILSKRSQYSFRIGALCSSNIVPRML